MARDIRKRFAGIGLTARIAIAPTAAAAWALAHHAPCICGEDVEAKLAPLHVSSLQLDPDTVRTLERLDSRPLVH